MKISLYLEFYHFLNGRLFKKIGTGLLSSYENQKRTLQYLGIDFTEKYEADCDILQINTPWIKSLYLIRKAKRQGKKIIIWSHVTAEDVVGVFRFSKIFSPLIKKYLTYAYGLADLVLCPSEYTKSLLSAYGLSEKKLTVLSNGVDMEKVYQNLGKRELYRHDFNLNALAVGMIGLVIPRKGTKTFLHLAKIFPETQFIWYGKIYSSLLVEALPKTLPANIRFTGYVEDLAAALNSLDIFIFPSYEENEGMAILEAAAVGLPILVRDIPVYEGWLEHNVNCLKAKDEAEFDHYLEMLIKDPGLRLRLGQGAKIMAQNRSKTVLAQKILANYQRLLVDKPLN